MPAGFLVMRLARSVVWYYWLKWHRSFSSQFPCCAQSYAQGYQWKRDLALTCPSVAFFLSVLFVLFLFVVDLLLSAHACFFWFSGKQGYTSNERQCSQVLDTWWMSKDFAGSSFFRRASDCFPKIFDFKFVTNRVTSLTDSSVLFVRSTRRTERKAIVHVSAIVSFASLSVRSVIQRSIKHLLSGCISKQGCFSLIYGTRPFYNNFTHTSHVLLRFIGRKMALDWNLP